MPPGGAPAAAPRPRSCAWPAPPPTTLWSCCARWRCWRVRRAAVRGPAHQGSSAAKPDEHWASRAAARLAYRAPFPHPALYACPLLQRVQPRRRSCSWRAAATWTWRALRVRALHLRCWLLPCRPAGLHALRCSPAAASLMCCPAPAAGHSAEVLGFAVPQFVSGRAHRVLQRVAASRPMAARLRLREAHLLQPLAGVLLALWRAEQEALGRADAQQPEEQGQQRAPAPRRHSLLRALDRQAALTDAVLHGLARAEVRPLFAATIAGLRAPDPARPLGCPILTHAFTCPAPCFPPADGPGGTALRRGGPGRGAAAGRRRRALAR